MLAANRRRLKWVVFTRPVLAGPLAGNPGTRNLARNPARRGTIAVGLQTYVV